MPLLGLGGLRRKRNEVDIPLFFSVPRRKIQFELDLGEILPKRPPHFLKILFLALARLGRCVKMQRQTLIPGAVLVLDED